MAPDRSREPNPECPVCGVYNTSVVVDLERTTLKDLVEEFIKLKLGYTDKEFVVSNDVGILYEAINGSDDDEDEDNLPKKLSELGWSSHGFLLELWTNNDAGIKQDSFLTVTDEDDEDTFVNVIINVQQGFVSNPYKSTHGLTSARKFEGDKKPIDATFTENPEIPRKPKKPEPLAPAEVNGNGQQNGKHALDDEVQVVSKGVKRTHADEDGQPLKKAKIADSAADIVVVEDAGGAIVIDD